MEQNNNNKITSLSDAEFLSFLYSERDRENNLRQYQGWNIWALIGSLVAVGCAAYQLLKDNIETILYVQVCYYSSALLAFALCIHPILSFLLKKERGVDIRKLKRLKQTTPFYYLGWGIVVSTAFAVAILLMDVAFQWNVVSITWMIVLALYLAGTISAIINKEKETNSFFDELVFANIKLNRCYEVILTIILWNLAVFSFSKTPKFEIGNINLEISVSLSAFVVLFYYLIKVFCEERKANDLDVLIDEYLYKGLSKEKVYENLLHERMGYRVIESFFKEIDDIDKTVKSYEQKKSELEEVDTWLNDETISTDKIGESLERLHNTLSYLRECDKRVREISRKLLSIVKQVPFIVNDEEFKLLTNLASSLVGRIEELTNLTGLASKKIGQWVKNNVCERYGGYCKIECAKRHKKLPLLLRIKRWWKRKIAKGLCY
ncbi:MAG: hypothetical protein IKS65_03135 [Bacteroidales bacterium]|nr:hypothetical protein [Bacteroidales bacterium]